MNLEDRAGRSLSEHQVLQPVLSPARKCVARSDDVIKADFDGVHDSRI